MGFKRIFVVVASGLFLTTCGPRTYAQSTGLRTWLDDRGSVPPVHQWFRCVKQLEHKPFDKRSAQDCLESLLSHPEIEWGRITLKHYKDEDLLTFRLQSPRLVVTDMDLGVAGNDVEKLRELLAANGNAQRSGEPYEMQREGSSWNVLDMLLRSQGRRAGVSRTLHLDYGKKTAKITYKVWEGPSGEPEPLVPPYAAPCPILNANFNGFDWDDFTPVEYVRRQMKTKWLGCFSEKALREDEDRLKRMPFLKESQIFVSGSGIARNFGFHFRSEPIPIAKVTVHGYGLLSGISEADIPSLTVHVGDTYSQSRVHEQENSLEKAYERTDWQLKTFTDVQISPEGKASLDFSLLAYPDDTVYLNDKAYDVTHFERN